MGGRVKKGNCKNRGYIGYHITWDNKKVFLRSKSEFIYARKLDFDKTPYLTEADVYDIGGRKYKPDFFIYENTDYKKIIKIVEIKGSDDKKTSLLYLESFKNYFNNINIEYDVIWKFIKIIKKYNLTDEIKNWIQNSITYYDNISDVSGKNNPMFGLKQSDNTKQKISIKAKNRCNDEKYLKMMSDVQMEYWNSEAGIKRRKEISEEKKILYNLKNPIINSNCKECNIIFNKRINNTNEFCSGKCKRKWLYKNNPNYGKHKNKTSYANQIKTYINRMLIHYNISYNFYVENIDEITQKAKEEKIIPKNKGISLKTIKKYKIKI
jgi:hypothetical protein